MAGRRPIPTAIKVANGNPGKRALNEREPKPRQRLPKKPAHLGTVASAEWRRLVRILAPMGVLTEAEADVLALYCQAYERWVEASNQLQKFGMVAVTERGTPVVSPYVRILMQTVEQMRRLMIELGLTPTARVRMVAPEPADDALDAFLLGGGM